MVIRQAKYKAWSKYDCYTYLVFVDLDEDISNNLGLKHAVRLNNYWVWLDDLLVYPESHERYIYENWAHKISDRQIEKWLG